MDKMEKSDKVTTHDDQSELTTECGEDDYSRKLSPEELKVKIRMFRNLCLDKKINASNAFDIDMIGYFKTWLAESRNQSSEDISSFIEIADYLDASGTVYSYRVDNLSETTSQLVEKFRVINYKKELDDDEVDEPVKTHKPKRTKLMLTTAEKLHNKSMDSDIINPSTQGIPNLDYKEMYTHTSPADYMMSLFQNTTLKDDLKKYNDDKENKNYGVVQIRNLEDELTKKVICPDFHEFVAERDREDNYEISPLECIEDRFDPNDHHYSNMTINSISNVFNGYEDRTENNPSLKDNDQSAIGGLLECIDGVDRDYSFFNPQLLANWKGPKAWKAQAMVKALKSCNPSERKDLMSISDDFNEEEVVKPKEIKKRNKVENKKVKIEWMKMDSIHKILEEKVQGKEKVLPRLLQKWNAFDNIGDARTIGVDIVYNFENLKYSETYPDWWKQKKNKNTKISAEEIIPGPSPKHQDINDCDEVIETAETEYNDKTADDIDEFENNEPENEDCEQAASCDHNESEESHSSNDIFKEIKTEAKMDIGVLKKEILEIINQECVDIDDNSNWSSQLPFENLLCKLKVNEREGLSVSIAFVALLHLTNEKGLKLSQEYSGDINNMKSIYISKPLGKN